MAINGSTQEITSEAAGSCRMFMCCISDAAAHDTDARQLKQSCVAIQVTGTYATGSTLEGVCTR